MLIDRTHRAVGHCERRSRFVRSRPIGYAGTMAVSERPWSGGSAHRARLRHRRVRDDGVCRAPAARKKLPIWRVGRAQTWMRGHLWLGLLSFPLILFHAGFAFGGLADAGDDVDCSSSSSSAGWLARRCSTCLPRLMFERVPMETIYEQIPHVRAQLLAEARRHRRRTPAARWPSSRSRRPSGDVGLDREAGERRADRGRRLGAAARVLSLRDGAVRRRPGQARIRSPDRQHADQAFARLRTLLPPAFHVAPSPISRTSARRNGS